MSNFYPNWASPPSDTIKDILSRLGISIEDFFNEVNLSDEEGVKLLDGTLVIDKKLADLLSRTLGSTPSFWLERDSQYRDDSIRIQEVEYEGLWMNKLPLEDLVKYRWIEPNLKQSQKRQACLEYFGVKSFTDLSRKYEDQLNAVAFRSSESFDVVPEAVVAWLRQGEKQVFDQTLNKWNKKKFKKAIYEARSLTMESDPKVFIPRVRSLFSECGVAIAVAPTPKGCPVSGAVYFFSPDKAVILLSFRYLSDDHFWFTLFHECGHLLLHENSQLFLEGEPLIEESKKEKEANEFSARFLIPEEFESELIKLTDRNLRGILKFSRKVGVSRGIIVGQLQHRGIISHKKLNRLKVRYRWK